MKRDDELTAIIAEAVKAARDACMEDVDEKIAAAVDLGVKIGAAAGAEIGAKAAIRAVDRERGGIKRAQYDRRLRNTKLLLKNYRTLREHCRNAAYDVSSAAEESDEMSEIMELMNASHKDESLYVESIKQTAIRTGIILAHIDRMLRIYEALCAESGRESDRRRWRILHALYIAEGQATPEELAEEEEIDKRTVYRDIDACADDLAVLFFGIDGIRDLS